jgi:hypothetical protein
MLLKVTRKFLIFHWLQTCQGSGVGSIPIGRSIKTNKLRSNRVFHVFQNINFVAKLRGKFSLYVLDWDLSGVQPRHCSGRMAHLLTDDCWIDTGKFPAAVASPTEGVQTRLLEV